MSARPGRRLCAGSRRAVDQDRGPAAPVATACPAITLLPQYARCVGRNFEPARVGKGDGQHVYAPKNRIISQLRCIIYQREKGSQSGQAPRTVAMSGGDTTRGRSTRCRRPRYALRLAGSRLAHDARQPGADSFSMRLCSRSRASRERQITSTVFSPPIVPTTSLHPAESIASATGCAPP